MKTVVTQFLEQARKYPDNPAVLDISGTYTYERLNLRSAYLAERILENIGGKGQREGPGGALRRKNWRSVIRTKPWAGTQISILRKTTG